MENDTGAAFQLDSSPEAMIQIKVEFTGGLEMLFSDQREHQLSLPRMDETGCLANIAFLVRYLCSNVMTDKRKEMFVLDEAVRPGILVLINDADWELEGENSYVLREADNIFFVSTLHGG
ncbi:MAG: Ubiquitin- modifier 1 [Pycnora praestabilis]|nr:MAG: Ubiquitin- modifier 1 [Pycnora praestabilis]